MSKVVEIYQNLAALQVAVGGAYPTVFGLDATPNRVDIASLPCRILLPGRSTQGSFGFVAMGTMGEVEWSALDLLLIKATGQGRGLIDVSTPMLAYCGAYAETMRSFRNAGIVGGSAWLDQVQITPGVYEYPQGSGNEYHGVLCSLTFKEVLSG